MGISVFPDGGGGNGSFGGKILNLINTAVPSAVTINASSYLDLLSINGTGTLSELFVYVNPLSTNNAVGVSIFVDGVEYPFFYPQSNIAKMPTLAGSSEFISGTSASVFHTKLEIAFKNNITIKLKNIGTASTTAVPTLRGGYYS